MSMYSISYYFFYLLIQIAESLSKILIRILGGETRDVDLFFKKDDKTSDVND